MSKKIVLYFSIYGTTKRVAEKIAKVTGADIMEIEPKVSYDGNRDHYNALAEYAKKEHDMNQRPEIKNSINIEEYDTVFIGYPMWWYTFPMIIYTLFEKYNFEGKTIVPFNTHLGSRDGGTYKTIQELAPKAIVLEGLPVDMHNAEKGDLNQVDKWIQSINE